MTCLFTKHIYIYNEIDLSRDRYNDKNLDFMLKKKIKF